MKIKHNRFAVFPVMCHDCHRYIWMEPYRRADANPSTRLGWKAVNFISTLDGMIAAHSYYSQGMLLYFDSYNNAKIGINKVEEVGIQCEKNIDEFLIREDGALEFMKGMK
ncbi:MAG: hypothetical protein Q4G53_09230 [Clostridia bacterium]|nr:hypothetical protein [Clostridia bacterium]